MKRHFTARCQWLTPVILATPEAETRRTVFQSQPRQILSRRLYLEKTHYKNRAGGVAQGISPQNRKARVWSWTVERKGLF
jgi:hypothetical protein